MVDQDSTGVVVASERCKVVPLKEREVEWDQETGRDGIARQRGKEEGRWMTERSRREELIRRKPREKVDVGSVRMDWN